MAPRHLILGIVAGLGLYAAERAYAADPPACMNDEQQALLESINKARAKARKCGKQSMPAAPPVRWHCKIVAAAEAHSEDMARNSFLSHEGSDGKRVFERLQAAGYLPQAWGENVSGGREQAAPTVYAWLNSPQHCVNLMKYSFTHVGGALAINEDSYYRWYWTVAFARPRR
ncbi:MAG: CAP domain-containing protein [Pseudomonadota bacterium]